MYLPVPKFHGSSVYGPFLVITWRIGPLTSKAEPEVRLECYLKRKNPLVTTRLNPIFQNTPEELPSRLPFRKTANKPFRV